MKEYFYYYRKSNPFPVRGWHLLIITTMIYLILIIVVPVNIEKIGEYDKQHIITRKTLPVWPFNKLIIKTDTVLKDHIEELPVVDFCGDTGIHVLKDGKEKHIHVTNSSFFKMDEKVKVFISNYPEEITEIAEDRITTNVTIIDGSTGQKYRTFKIEKKH